MESNTLDEQDSAVLEAIEKGVSADRLDSKLEASRGDIDECLDQLVDNGLVRQAGDGYELTDNGKRVLEATPSRAKDDRIDTSEAVEAQLECFSLPPDETDAIRRAFTFLKYWGDATTAEIVNAVYSEAPAGYSTAESWWGECVREALVALPGVRFLPDQSPAEWWRYDGEALVLESDDEDGRESRTRHAGSVRHGLERQEMTERERTAARVAFAVLHDVGTMPASELVESVYEKHPASYDSAEEWIDWLDSVFESLPGVERESETADESAWSYKEGVSEQRHVR